MDQYQEAVSALNRIYYSEVKDLAECIFEELVQPSVNALDVATSAHDKALEGEEVLEQRLALLEVDLVTAQGEYASADIEGYPEEMDGLYDKIEALEDDICATSNEIDQIEELDNTKDECENALEIAINEALDNVHESVDSHQWIIYAHYHATIILCSNADASDFIDESALGRGDLTSLAFGILYVDVAEELNRIIGDC